MCVMGGAAVPNLAFTARTGRSVYDPGSLAKVSVTLTNVGSDPVTMRFGEPCFMQFLVLDPTGQAVYNSSKWWNCIALLTDVTLVPGESRSQVFAWNLSSDAGTPLPGGHEYRGVPSFVWGNRTISKSIRSTIDVATFTRTN